MITVYSKQLFSVSGLLGVGASVVCPSGYTMVLAHTDVFMGMTASGYNIIDDSTGGTFMQDYNTGGLQYLSSKETRVVFEEGQGFHFAVTVAACDCFASGYLLLGTPPPL